MAFKIVPLRTRQEQNGEAGCIRKAFPLEKSTNCYTSFPVKDVNVFLAEQTPA